MPIKEAKRGLKSFAAEGKKNYHPYLNPVKNMAMKPDTVPGIPGLEDYYIDRTDDPEQVKKIIDADAARKRRTDIFAQAEALFSDEILILNDIVLDNVPTTGISITYTSDIFVSETIRTSAPSVSTGGREDVILELNLVFQPGKAQTIKLRRLMAEIINHPFIFVWSNKIRRNLSIPDDESTVFVLENGAIRSITGQPGTIALDLTLHYFNHRPFSHHFFYNTYLPGQGPEVNKQDPTSAIEPGNEEASYSESHKVKEAQAKGKELAKTLDDKRSKNVPAIFPWDSQPWLYYASTLEDTVPTISEDYCDYIGFKLNRFRYINPPPQAQTGGTLKDFLLKNPNVEEAVGIWKLSSGVSDFIAKGAAKGQADKQVKDESEAQAYYTQEKNMREGAQTSVPSGKRDPILLYSNAYKIEKRIQLVNENGSVRREAVDEIYDLVKPLARSAKNTETKIHPDVLILLQHVADNYPGKKIIIISGIRGAFTTEDLKVANASLRDNRHSHLKGHAIDILVEGISEEKLHEFTRTIPYCGSIQYTSSLAEVHIEISSRMEGFWEVKDKDNKTPLAAGRNSGTVKKQLIPPTGEQAKKDVVSAKTKQEQERQKILDRAKQKDVPIKETSGSAPKEKQSRIDWIRNIENLEGITYYLGSKNVRNVFYETLQLNTSGDKEDQDTGLALPNLACTAIAVSFGHKLAPLGLASQKRYSYQFVGAGNKAGQLVFTFAGPEGRASADALKNLFSLAKDNALYFGQMIDDAGSLELVSDDYQANRQNAILALAGVRNVIISNVEERSIPGSSDKYALVIDFVGQQDKVSNKLQRRFHSTVESKRKLVKGLLRMIDRVSGTIIVNPNIASSRITGLDPNARPYRLGKNTPPWIAELAIATKAACEKTDNASPPLAWQTASGNTWTQRYAYWGAEKIILGKSKNIILDGTFAKDVATNVVIERELANWEAEMELIVRKAKEHLGDEESFKKYFGEEVYQDIVTTVMLGTSGCYDDLKLPSYPGTTVAMPPEFYVYDDSDENPSISSLSDAGSTRALIKKVIEREVESHNVMALQTFASNLYVSKNFWNIKKNRLGELESYKTVEFEQFKENNLFSDGALAWEPVYHRNGYDDPLWNNENTNEWKNLVSKAYGDNTTFGFLDRVIQLAPAIQFEDETPTAGAGAAASATVQEGLRSGRSIRSAFGDEWNTVSFGPNLKNIYVDAIQEGRIVDDSAKAIVMASDNPEALKQQAELTGKETVVGTMTITPDGTITVGETFAEREAAKTPGLFGDRGLLGTAKDLYQQETGIELGKDWRQTAIIAPGLMLSATATAIAGTAWVIGEYIQSTTGIKTFANIGLALTAISAIPAIAHTKLAQTLNEKPQNPAEAVGALNSLNDTYKKLMPLSYSKNRIDIMADETLAYSLAGKSKDINFRRAFPTFKIYFIESDTDDSYEKNGKIIRAFDDFYDYSAIEEIRVIKSKDIPADLAVIRMANLGSNLFAKRFGDDYDRAKQAYEDAPESQQQGYNFDKEIGERQGLYADTDKEDPFDKFVFQDGVRIQIRLGYDDSPDRLTTVFLGQIVEIGTSADGKLLEIVCQGFGAELESVELGGEDKTVFFSSQSALSSAILQPTIVNFGRRDRNAAYSPGTTRNKFTGGAGTDHYESIIIRDWFEGKRDQYFNRYTFLNDPQDDNIFAPSPTTYTGAWERFWNNACAYRPLKITPWEVFKEHELRHPGYISLPVPYGHTNRMTMFFGSKSQHYWCKPPSSLEVLMAEGAQDQAIRARGLLVKNPKNASVVSDKINELAKTMPTIAEAMLRDILSNSSAVGASFEIAKMFGRYVPFRNYHYFDSTYHILANNIKCSSENIANEVEISYFDSENSLRGGFLTSGDDASEIIADTANGEADTYSVKLDDNIPEDKIKTYHDEYPSCITKYMAKRYAQGLFERILKEAYSGELTVIGDETIKPYDILNIFDKTINMSGPAEVKEVIHLFNRSEGFVSIVSPGMCVSVNDGFDVPILNSMLAMQSLMWNYADSQNLDTSFTAATKLGSTIGLPFMGFIFYQLATQEGTPVFVHPMTLNGVAFSPSMIKKSGNLISSTLGRWKQWWTDLGAAFKELDVSESLVDARIDLIGSILNWMSRTTEKR